MVPSSKDISENLRPLNLVLKSTICAPKLVIDDNYVQKQYCENGLNMTQIARLLNTSRHKIKASLVRSGVVFDLSWKQKEALRYKKFGYKRERKKTVEHKAEQRTINAIMEMINKGLSYQEIADILHQMKIPTKTSGKRWTRGMVRNIDIKSTDT
jgi:predicted DNA-binding protein YlxM (UPF0122 family)